VNSFAVFDIDGTLIRWQLFHAIVHGLGKHGYISPEAHDRIKEARKQWKVRTNPEGFAAYEHVLVTEYLAVLSSIEPNEYFSIVSDVFDEYKDQTHAYTRNLLKDLKSKGYKLIAISGSQQEIIERLAEHYGFDYVIGSTLEQVDGKFTGKIDTPIFDKAKVLNQVIGEHSLSKEGSIAVGDSSSDIPMFELVENPIVFNPDQKLFKVAKERQWKIVVERKNMIYELEPKNGQYLLS